MPTATILDTILHTFNNLFLIECDDTWSIRSVNHGFADFIGLSPEHIQGRCFLDLLTADARKSLLDSASRFGPADDPLLLHLAMKGYTPRPMRVLHEQGKGIRTLIGEPIIKEEARFQDEIVELNNQMANLTRENARKKRQLSIALTELKEAQSLLVHREKMASLGQMTAGIAHEINNPIAFVLNNQVTLGRDFADILAFIDCVEKIKPEIGAVLPHLLHAITEAEEAGDIGYLAESIPKKIEANLEGLRRVKQLVLDLRTFARLDEAEMKEADLSEGIRKCIQFLEPLIREHQISIETIFEKVPPAFCSHGAIHQAISNIVGNAIQASRPGKTVRVSLKANSKEHVIEVEDEGEGIPDENLTRIFNPFFTTKPVGSGTGLGLSIASQIIARHHGAIEVASKAGVGTRMTIRLPFARGTWEASTQEMSK